MNDTEKQLELFDYDDSILTIYDVCQQYGVRKVLEDFRRMFPDMYQEILAQINRGPERSLPALLRPPEDAGPV